ncbi:class I SAM-dependent methyltransferase [Methylosinus sp. LW4]|uniref:class I SAM-dependent methyltransferase n=1 Tax=Methylosinus sp. LW4 TaxID=136993 RepID=UPI000A062827|nr:methyltransferase domain-containing protein [Methylosinus sp. LW4]
MSNKISGEFELAEGDPLRYERSLDMNSLDPFESDAIICELIPPGSRVLEIGCGTGSLLKLIQANLATEVIGVEPNEERAVSARSKGLMVTTGIATSEFLESVGTFDVIIFADVLEHLQYPGETLLRVRESIRPGGIVIASVPNVAHWSIRLSLAFGFFEYKSTGLMDYTHLRWFTASSFSLLFHNSGYNIRCSRRSHGYWMINAYRSSWPFSFISDAIKRPLLKWAVRAFPNLFGYQHIISASVASNRNMIRREADTYQHNHG